MTVKVHSITDVKKKKPLKSKYQMLIKNRKRIKINLSRKRMSHINDIHID